MKVLKRTDKYVVYSENGVVYVCSAQVFDQKYKA